jgi:hypothetical protein
LDEVAVNGADVSLVDVSDLGSGTYILMDGTGRWVGRFIKAD